MIPRGLFHFFIFENEAAHKAHSPPYSVKYFEAADGPELDGGDVEFVDYDLVAAKQ
jgi:hypothetical protein